MRKGKLGKEREGMIGREVRGRGSGGKRVRGRGMNW